MSESDSARRRRLLKALRTRGQAVPPELMRLADAVWSENDAALTHEACMAALPTFVSDEVEGKPVAQLYPAIKHHLDRCPRCATQYADLLEVALAEANDQLPQAPHLRGPDLSFLPSQQPSLEGLFQKWVQEPLAAFVAQIQGRNLALNVALGAQAATTHVEKGETAGGVLRWQISEDDERNLVIELASPRLELEGAPLRLISGAWQRDVILKRVTPDQVGVREQITRQERSDIPADTPLRVEIPISS